MPADRPTRAEALLPAWTLSVTLLALIVVLGIARLSVEGPFFSPTSLLTTAGLAPVPQDDPSTPALDNAMRNAAAALSGNAVCVIAQDSWNRDYFRASYFLMPRMVWPVAPLLSRYPPSLQTISAALVFRTADCLLAPSGVPAPHGWRRLTNGVYALYIPPRQS